MKVHDKQILTVTEGTWQTHVNSYRVHDKQMLTVTKGTGQTNVNSYRRSRTNTR